MLELGPRELLTFGIVLGGIATTWGVLKATIKSITATLDEVRIDLASLNQRLDKVEARQAVALSIPTATFVCDIYLISLLGMCYPPYCHCATNCT